jgi:hypothetical protein
MRLKSMRLVLTLLAGVACADTTDPDTPLGPAGIHTDGELTFRGQTAPSVTTPGWLATTLYVRGASLGGLSLQYGGCPFTVRMYRTPDRAGLPAWDALAVPNTACQAYLVRRHLGFGEELALTALTLPREVLGDSLPAGRYHVAALVRPNGDSVVVAAGHVDLAP